MQWLNEPASWQRVGDELTVTVDPDTDFWRETGYGYVHDNGHVYGEVLPGDLDMTVRIRGNFATQYDQAGIMLRADERTWLKTGVEFFEGRPRLSTVLTLGQSSWAVTELPGWPDEITMRAARRGDAVEVRYAIGDGELELAALVFMPADVELLAGVMCAAPEGLGFRVTFSDLTITDRAWVEVTDEEMAAWADAQESSENWPGTDTMALPVAMVPPAGGHGVPEPTAAGPAATGYRPAEYAAASPADADPQVTGDALLEPPQATGGAGEDSAARQDSTAEDGAAGEYSAGQDSGAVEGSGAREDGEDEPGPSGEDEPGPSGEVTPPGSFVASPPPDFGTATTEPAAAIGAAPSQAGDRATPAAGAGTAAGGAAPSQAGDRATPAAGAGTAAGDTGGERGAAGDTGGGERGAAGAPAPSTPPGPGPAADWERLAARIRARHWVVPDDGNLSDSWPGPPVVMSAADTAGGDSGSGEQEAVASPGGDAGEPTRATTGAGAPVGDDDETEPHLPAARDDTPPDTGAPPDSETPDTGAPPDSETPATGAPRDSETPAASGTRDSETPAASGTRAGKSPRRLTFKPRIDLPAPPDPADEWISLLTADPADE
jgi:regulation of enolase protein 1 (concanavalin A-like superfamily)